MTTPESFNDQELSDLLNEEMLRGSQEHEAIEQYTVIHDKLWTAIELLEIHTCCGPDPDNFNDEYDALVEILRTITEVDSFDGNRDILEQHIHITAREIWDNDANVIAQVALAIEEQLYPSDQSINQALIKKTITAKLIADGKDIDRWLPLIDYTLTGDLLDTSRSEDMEIMMHAIENHANEDSLPQVQLYRQLLTALGIEEIDDSIDDPLELQRIDTLTLAARDFTELAYYMPGPASQPNRHEQLHELVRAYKITDDAIIKAVIELTDAFENKE